MVEEPPLFLKNQVSVKDNYSIESCSVAVIYCIYDKHKKCIVNHGTSRACGDNSSKISIHAEQICLKYCKYNDKKHNYEIYIWRYSKQGKIKPVYCCESCCKLLNKFNYFNRIYTFEDGERVIPTSRPYITLGKLIKYG
jgi:hypothetical protein